MYARDTPRRARCGGGGAAGSNLRCWRAGDAGGKGFQNQWEFEGAVLADWLAEAVAAASPPPRRCAYRATCRAAAQTKGKGGTADDFYYGNSLIIKPTEGDFNRCAAAAAAARSNEAGVTRRALLYACPRVCACSGFKRVTMVEFYAPWCAAAAAAAAATALNHVPHWQVHALPADDERVEEGGAAVAGT